MTNAEALASTIDRGEEFARRFSDIDTLGRIEAIIAIAAIIRWTFSEVTQQYGPAATARLHQSTKRGDAGALARLPRFIQFEDALARLREIFRAPEKMRFRSEEHTSDLQSLMRISYAVFCLKQKKNT